MELRAEVKELLIETAKDLRAAAGRTGVGLESWDDRAPVNTNWNTGLSASMHTHHEAANRVEEHLPNLLSDITAIVDGQSQADPQCAHEPSLHPPDGNRSASPVDWNVRLP